MAKKYSLVVGAVLLLIGILGFIKGTDEFMGLHFNLAHNLIHTLSGIVGIAAGMSKSGNAPKMFAQVFGVVYTLVGLAGFAGVPAFVITTLDLNPLYNIIHLAVGVLGILVGFVPMKQATA
jgi:uncharacterized membrane protein HdeD (DUF308 family)